MVTLLDALRAWTVLFGIHVANATRGVEMEILVLLWYLLAAVGVALAASERGRGFLTWTVAALFLSPLFAVLLLIAFPPTARARAGAFVGPSSNAAPGRKYRKLTREEPATAGEAPDRSTLTDLIEAQSPADCPRQRPRIGRAGTPFVGSARGWHDGAATGARLGVRRHTAGVGRAADVKQRAHVV